ncbi:MAG: hypothetical protein BGO01_14190 [Armatimonadetes bacterium 55-13]|nr:hypothetical protein [Armatimonadota bacterium]OJU64871.1 MAG: hypothetical protein BGO01_14190 [Armatimonadetes bacterium 55-13]
MSVRLFGCSKYQRLSNEKFDRTLSLAEREFLAKHRSVCSECRMRESQSSNALNMLRMAAFDDEVQDSFEPQFEERILRKLRVQSTRESVRYWSPAFVGAMIAGLAVLATLQLVPNRPSLPSSNRPEGTAYRTRGERLPTLDINKLDRIR